MEGNVTITKQRYFELMLTEEKLARLEAGGVDNWEWYGDSMRPDGVQTMREFKEELTKAIEDM